MQDLETQPAANWRSQQYRAAIGLGSRLTGPKWAAWFCGALLAAAVSGAVAAEYGKPLSIRQFVSLCSDTGPAPVAAGPGTVCEGYVVGFLESAGLLEHANRSPPRYCLPVAVSPREVANFVVEAAKGAPSDEYPAAMVLRAVLENRFTCPAKA